MSTDFNPNGRYRLEVVGGNAIVNRAVLRPVATSGSSSIPGVAAGSQSTGDACELVPAADLLTLYVNNPSSTEDKRIYALRGPSGKGDLQLIQTAQPGDGKRGLIGSTVKHDGWRVVSHGGRMLLRYAEEPAGLSHWVAAPRKGDEGEDVWTFWWVAPNAANMDDLPGHVLVDIEVVSV